MMKTWQMMIRILVVAGISMANPVCGEISAASWIAPEDIGAVKWKVTGKGGDGEVVIFRTVCEVNGVFSDAHDMVYYRPGQECEGSVFAINPDFFRPKKDRLEDWHIAAFGGSRWVKSKGRGTFCDGKNATLTFHTEEGEMTLNFFVLVVKYEEAVKNYDKESPMPGIANGRTWMWGGTPLSVK